MIITKVSLPRRTFLRGLGATVSLPLLDAMIPAGTALAKTVGAPVTRVAFWGTANGVFGPHFKPAGSEINETGSTIVSKLTDYPSSPILAPLETFRNEMVVATQLGNLAAESKQVGSGVHARAASCFLSGCAAKRTEGADIELGTTLDQYAARELGRETQLTSLEMAIESSFVGNCDQGYSCVYVNTFSWRTPTMPLPMENNPRVVFERLFGDGGTTEQRLGQMRRDRSILDFVGEDLARLQKGLGAGDRKTVDEYLDALRDVESRIQKAERNSATTELPLSAQPAGIPESYADHADLMVDLQFLAFQADVTRVITFQTSREQGGRQFPFIGVPEAHHETSHHQGDPYKIQQNTKINTYFVQLFANLAEKMRNTPDGDGSLLDHAMLLWGCGLGSGDIHSPHDMPIAVVGGASGQLKGNRLLQYPMDTPFMNFGLSLLDKVGVHLEGIGDSTGRVTDL
ncbi:MAG: DUF1552 domain-containing protein [Acidimicrobiia bacterium]|nr:DUF1552 domain-containing protein [Acidimicrobiia bacterium]